MNIKSILKNFTMKYCANAVVISILGITVYLLFSNLSVNPLENDELFTLNMLTRNSLFEIIRIGNMPDATPPLYHIVMFFYTRIFEVSEYMMRIPSVIFFLIASYLSFIFVKRFFGITESIVTVIVMITLFPHAWVSQYARGYSLFLMIIVTTMLFISNIIKYKKENIEKNIPLKMLVCYIASAFFCNYINYFGAVLVFFELLFLFIVFNKKIVREIIIIVISLTILYLPWLLIISLHEIPQSCPDFLEWINWSVYASYNLFVVLFLAFIPLLPLIFDVIKYRNIKVLYDKHLYVSMLFFLFLIPYLTIYCIHNLGITCYQSKYLIISIIPFYILIAHGISLIGKKQIIIFLFTAIFVIQSLRERDHYVPCLTNSEYIIKFVINNHNQTQKPVLFINNGYDMFTKHYKYHYDKYLTNKDSVRIMFDYNTEKIKPTIEEIRSQYNGNYIWVIDCTLVYDIKKISDEKNIVMIKDNLPKVYLLKIDK